MGRTCLALGTNVDSAAWAGMQRHLILDADVDALNWSSKLVVRTSIRFQAEIDNTPTDIYLAT